MYLSAQKTQLEVGELLHVCGCWVGKGVRCPPCVHLNVCLLYIEVCTALCRDPNLWVVKCRMGEEKAVVVHLMRKVIAYQFTEEVGFVYPFYVTRVTHVLSLILSHVFVMRTLQI